MTTAELQQTLADANRAFLAAADERETAATNLIEAKIRERFPTADHAEVTVILTEDYTEHDIRIFDANGDELTDGTDFPTDEDCESWWMLASESVALLEGDRFRITI
jgi:hypothetical protein